MPTTAPTMTRKEERRAMEFSVQSVEFSMTRVEIEEETANACNEALTLASFRMHVFSSLLSLSYEGADASLMT